MTFQFFDLWGTIIAFAQYQDKKFSASGKTKDEAIAKIWKLATN